MEYRRLFIAIAWQPDETFLSCLAFLRRHCARDLIRWEPKERYHLTLAFLGGVKEDKIAELISVVGEVATKHAAFDLSLKGLHQFGSSYKSKVLWFGVEASDSLAHLHSDLLHALQEIGLRPFGHRYVPHISIGRVKKIADGAFFRKLVASQADKEVQKAHINDIVLFESVLHHRGAEHIVLHRAKLQ